MAYNLRLAERIRYQLEGMPYIEKKMFGGVSYLLHGNMACGVIKDDLIVRVDPQEQFTLLKKPHVKLFDMTGRPMKGWLVVEPDGIKTARQIGMWVKRGSEFALTRPPK
jgi:TfoX/Sxy family transcriptional regulator of competence genes